MSSKHYHRCEVEVVSRASLRLAQLNNEWPYKRLDTLLLIKHTNSNVDLQGDHGVSHSCMLIRSGCTFPEICIVAVAT